VGGGQFVDGVVQGAQAGVVEVGAPDHGPREQRDGRYERSLHGTMYGECILMIIFSIIRRPCPVTWPGRRSQLPSRPMLRTRITSAQFAAALFAFLALGALIVHAQRVQVRSGWGVVAVLVAAVSHAFVYVMIKKRATTLHTLTLNTLPMTLAGLLLTIAGFAFERPGVSSFTVRSVGATLYLGVVGSVIGFALYFWLVQRLNTLTVSFTFVLFPIIAQFLAFLIEGTTFDWLSIILTLAVLAAFAVAQGRRRPSRQTAPAPQGHEASLT
jgi:hypothetical protein